jgi:uncharacterized BrkB/YihY/UPF0761 family membrane protein
MSKLLRIPITVLLIFWKLLKDFFQRGYTYHAGAVAFSAFLTLNAAVVFLGTILKYIPNKEKLIHKIYEIFPNISQDVVNLLIQSVENLSVKTQILTFLLVIFFIGNFLRTLELSFAFIANSKPRPLPVINYLLPFIFSFLAIFYGYLDMFLAAILHIFEKLGFIYPLAVKLFLYLKLFVDYLIYPFGLAIVYKLLSPVKVNFRFSFATSMVLSIFLNPLKALFGWYVSNFLIKNLVLTPFAGILVFLIWIYSVSVFILLGYRSILFLQGFGKREKEKTTF